MSAISDEARDKPRPFRARALILGFFLCAPAAYISTNQPVDAIFSLMLAPISILILLLLANVPLRLFLPKLALKQGDLIMIFAITSIAAAVSSEWGFNQHSAMFDLPARAEASPLVRDTMLPNLPDWLVSKDPAIPKDIQQGGRGIGYVFEQLPVLLPKYIAWGVLFSFLSFALLCINSLMRGAWLHREKLAFPLIQLPVAMTEGGGSGAMWRSKYMWLAFAVMFSIDILNGVNYLYPNVPAIPVKMFVELSDVFKEPPLSNMGSLPIAIYPFMAAIGIFVPSDLLFSMILFFLLRKATHVMVSAYAGIPQSTFSGTAFQPGAPYFDEQSWGAVFALFVTAIWFSRHYLKDVWAAIRSGAKPEDGGLTHRWAFIGLLFCFAGIMWYGAQGDLPVFYFAPYIAIFLVFSFVLTRVRAQLGSPTHEFAFFGPTSVMHRFVGNKWVTDKQATWLSQVFLPINRIHRAHPMPFQLEAMKIGATERLNQKTIFFAIVAATVIGFLLGHFFMNVLEYRTGSVYRYADGEAYLNTLLNNRHGPDVVGMGMTAFGFAFVLGLDALRFNFPGFPVHPAGYLLSMNYGVDYYWFGLLLALLIKNFVQRYYGLRGYDKLRNVALGILLAEYAAETIWAGIALVTNQSTYTISFNDRSLLSQ
ncbi:MAG: DUF6785 family protein [Fimbriimonadaceae bacterium]